MVAKLNGTKEEFAEWAKKLAADKDRKSREYLEFYYYVLHAFTEADSNYDGEIDDSEFHAMVERTKWLKEQNPDPKKLFKEIDTNNDGAISYNEMLKWAHGHVGELSKKF
jgi:Ca2+-binding EF-hand superfamily protein